MSERRTIDRLQVAIDACRANGRRILDEDVSFCEYNDPPATAYFLTMIAQEEFAKAFLLALVHRGAIPMNRHILRAARDHSCKQLLGLVMDHLHPDDEEWYVRMRRPVAAPWPQFPQRVQDAINIFRFEKVGRWESSGWTYVQEPAYDRDALAVAQGRRDCRKQDALYVRLGCDGGLASVPSATKDEVKAEIARARRFESCVRSMMDGAIWGFDEDEIKQAFRSAFESAVA